MNPSDIPPTAFVRSALEAMSKAKIEATVIYTVEKNGKRSTRADTNSGPVGMARQLAAVRISDGAIERAAVALHEFRVEVPPDVVLEPDDAEKIAQCMLCREKGNWSSLSDQDRDGHREIVKLVLGHALAGPPTSAGLVSV
jgi:hypothetical protein